MKNKQISFMGQMKNINKNEEQRFKQIVVDIRKVQANCDRIFIQISVQENYL